MKTVRKRPALGEGPRHRSFARSSSSSRESQYSGIGWIRNAGPPRLRRCFDVRHGDRQPKRAFLVQSVEQARKDFARVSRHDVLPAIEESELDEVVVQQGSAVGEAHCPFALDD